MAREPSPNEKRFRELDSQDKSSSNRLSQSELSRYDQSQRPEGMTRLEYAELYYRAWVRPGAFHARNGVPNKDRKAWFVEGVELMSAVEWDDKYGIPRS